MGKVKMTAKVVSQQALTDDIFSMWIQADEVAKKLQKKGGACYDAIVEHFGQEILDEKGELDRARSCWKAVCRAVTSL